MSTFIQIIKTTDEDAAYTESAREAYFRRNGVKCPDCDALFLAPIEVDAHRELCHPQPTPPTGQAPESDAIRDAFAERLISLGWDPSCDAQWEKIRVVVDEIESLRSRVNELEKIKLGMCGMTTEETYRKLCEVDGLRELVKLKDTDNERLQGRQPDEIVTGERRAELRAMTLMLWYPESRFQIIPNAQSTNEGPNE